MKFILEIPPPPTHQAALRILKTRDGRQFIGKMAKSSAKKWSNGATMLIKSEMNKQGGHMIDAPVAVFIKFFYKHTKESGKIAKREGSNLVRKATRPDVDNLAKSVLDSLVDAGVVKDDGLIYHLSLQKFYCEREFIAIDIEEQAAEL